MKKATLLLALFSLVACKKMPGTELTPQSIIASVAPLKLGDVVRWVNTINPTPNDKMVIKAVYYNDPAKPLTITVLDGATYYTDSATQFIIWK